MNTYTITVVRSSGEAHTTTAQGYYAESTFDRLFTEAKKDPRTMFAMVHDGGSIRQSYAASEIRR